MENARSPRLLELIIKTGVVHTVTYFVMGLLAFTFLHYAQACSSGTLPAYLRPTTDPLVMG